MSLWFALALAGCLERTFTALAAYHAQQGQALDLALVEAAILWGAVMLRLTVWGFWR